eukprot:scaffold442831_cov20-Prasinocladus_malaysianus.AAC.1
MTACVVTATDSHSPAAALSHSRPQSWSLVIGYVDMIQNVERNAAPFLQASQNLPTCRAQCAIIPFVWLLVLV